MLIRKSSHTDIDAVFQLIQNELGYKDLLEKEFEIQFRLMEDHPDYEILVAEENHIVLGFICHMKCIPIESYGIYYRIIGLAVKNDCQHKGIGTALIAAAECTAKNNNGTDIVLNSGTKRISAHEFYQSIGFRKKGFSFIKQI